MDKCESCGKPETLECPMHKVIVCFDCECPKCKAGVKSDYNMKLTQKVGRPWLRSAR
jgi:hypothetical protein